MKLKYKLPLIIAFLLATVSLFIYCCIVGNTMGAGINCMVSAYYIVRLVFAIKDLRDGKQY